MIAIWKRNYLNFKRNWISSLLAMVFEPVLILLVLGYGLGSFVPNVQGLSYIEFLLPSLAIIATTLISLYSSSYDCYHKAQPNELFSSIQATSLSEQSLFRGEAMWSASKGALAGGMLLLIGSALGLVKTWLVLGAIPILLLTSIQASTLGLFLLVRSRDFNQLSQLTTAVALPLTLFCGTLFPVSQYPIAGKYLVYLIPTTQSVSLLRSLLSDSLVWFDLGSFIYLIVASFFAWGVLNKLRLRTK